MRIFISNLQLLDIGGISTSLLNFLNELKKDNDITLCILSNYVSNNVSLPKEIRVIQGSNMLGKLLLTVVALVILVFIVKSAWYYYGC